ncbi:cellulase family glycosylhydrolase [Flavilitoribacter nigricans]|uniref:Uncharacterized protein n=1 Tax=Flavilitoribacter nigricans (strain ATCC 23147 / DSM 23189 / NBRC 102662 / NCIMB 1420 / SS-2) TaxID=1122177 RepID=A0A2D0NHB0_FLAN2|nr:cellulase family glycosylhydrolase [Flavilitoribacter nigricans]PHN07884.1 hypothetical protein CRP01_03790 [Flavilitoribacter nigricans DSM 23189 = NBRC 102662]
MHPLFRILLFILIPSLAFAQETRPEYNTGSGFFVKDGKIYDSGGNEFIPMGYNAAAFWAGNEDCKKTNMSVHIPNSGANAVRIISQTAGAFGWNANPAAQRNLVDRAVKAKMIPMLEMHNATCDEPQFENIVNYWTSEEMVKLCQDYEEYLWVNVANEHNFSDFEAWRDGYKEVITKFREAGIKNPIVIDAGRNCGQNPEMFSTYGAEVLESDPERNVIFSIHMYGFWRTEDKTFTDWTPPFQVETQLPALKAAGLPIMVGEFGWDDPEGYAGNYTAATIVSTCAEQGIGWFFWSFYDGTDKPYYSVIKNVCGGIVESNLTPAGQYILPYLQANASAAAIFGTVPTDEVIAGPSLQIYPNPSDSTFIIRGLSGPSRVRIADAGGALVRTVFLRDNILNLQDLPAGVYFLQIEHTVYKVIKK